MTNEEIQCLLDEIKEKRVETRNLELKSATKGAPHKIYDTLSAFSNQDDGGVIVFGIDERADFTEVGVANYLELQNSIANQCLEMEPQVRPLITPFKRENEDKTLVIVEVPGIDVALRPCYYKGKGLFKGSYIRVGDHDEQMTAYEIYSYKAFRNRIYDDIRPVERASISELDDALVDDYVKILKASKPHLNTLSNEKIKALMSIYVGNHPSLSALLAFAPYPQAYFPQLCITAVRIAGTQIGDVGVNGERFIDNKRIEGNIANVLEGAIRFVRSNMKIGTYIDEVTGRNLERTEYPMVAIREALLNAIVHRDYSIHTEGTPVQVLMFDDRIEILNPGGLYGRITIDQLGKQRTDTRNPVLATMLETMNITENRYSGIPVMRKECTECGLEEPLFSDNRGNFCVTFFNAKKLGMSVGESVLTAVEKSILEFCKTAKNKKEIAEHLELSSTTYAFKTYVVPLLKKGLLKMTLPDNPTSRSQKFIKC